MTPLQGSLVVALAVVAAIYAGAILGLTYFGYRLISSLRHYGDADAREPFCVLLYATACVVFGAVVVALSLSF